MASPRTSAMRAASPAARTFCAEREHRVREVDANDAAGAAPRRAFQRHVRRAGAHIQQRFAPGERQRADRPRPPAPVDAGAQDMIEKVVARRDRVEHPGDAVGSLVRTLCSSRDTSGQRVAAKYTMPT